MYVDEFPKWNRKIVGKWILIQTELLHLHSIISCMIVAFAWDGRGQRWWERPTMRMNQRFLLPTVCSMYTTRVPSTLEYERDQKTNTWTNVKSEINRKLITNLMFFPRLTREELMSGWRICFPGAGGGSRWRMSQSRPRTSRSTSRFLLQPRDCPRAFLSPSSAEDWTSRARAVPVDEVSPPRTRCVWGNH